MAFRDIKPVRVYDEASGCTYIIGEVFAVYSFGANEPTVYSWDMVRSAAVTRKSVSLNMDKSSYKIARKRFSVPEDYFRAVAIIECACKDYDIYYSHEKRMFPLKSEYTEVAPGKDAYFGEGMVDENEAAATFIALMNFKLMKVLWLAALCLMLLVLGGLHMIFGVTRENMLYFIPIAAASGGIITLLIYITCHAIAKARFRSIAECDPATKEVMSFVVCRQGYAACESCVYDGTELVPWDSADYFVESDKMFIFYRGNSAVVYIPKRAFDKKHVGGVADMIALNLEQR